MGSPHVSVSFAVQLFSTRSRLPPMVTEDTVSITLLRYGVGTISKSASPRIIEWILCNIACKSACRNFDSALLLRHHKIISAGLKSRNSSTSHFYTNSPSCLSGFVSLAMRLDRVPGQNASISIPFLCSILSTQRSDYRPAQRTHSWTKQKISNKAAGTGTEKAKFGLVVLTISALAVPAMPVT